ncbi:MAG: COG1361 S-layer family protein [Nanoarchaeota archaeon]
MRAFILLMALLMVGAVSAASSGGNVVSGADIQAIFLNQAPDPVEPNRIVEVRWRIENRGLSDAENVEIQLQPRYPFSLPPGEVDIKNIGTLISRQIDENGITVKFRVRVDANAVPGDNELALRYRVNQGGWITIDDYAIRVQSRESLLSIKEVTLTPQFVDPGKTSTISILLENLANSLLSNIKVNLLVKELVSTAATATYFELPLTPVDSANEKIIKSLEAGAEKEVTFVLRADPTAAPGVYKLPINLEYGDEFGRNFSRTLYTSFVIQSSPHLDVQVEQGDLLQQGMKGRAIIKFVNKGLHEIKFVDTTFEKGEGYKLLSPEKVYIGNVDSDDWETVDLELFIEGDVASLTIPVRVAYTDTTNQEFVLNKDIELEVYSAEDMKQLGLTNGDGTTGIVVIAIVVIVGFILYRIFRRKKKK